MPRGYPGGFSWRLRAAICRFRIRSFPQRLRERHDAVCREIPDLPQPTALSPPPPASPTAGEEKWFKKKQNTWRCPDQSADSPAGYWLSAPVCHCRPSKAEHHLLRARCDENKDGRGRRGIGWGRGVWVGGGGGGGVGGHYWHHTGPLCLFRWDETLSKTMCSLLSLEDSSAAEYLFLFLFQYFYSPIWIRGLLLLMTF